MRTLSYFVFCRSCLVFAAFVLSTPSVKAEIRYGGLLSNYNGMIVQLRDTWFSDKQRSATTNVVFSGDTLTFNGARSGTYRLGMNTESDHTSVLSIVGDTISIEGRSFTGFTSSARLTLSGNRCRWQWTDSSGAYKNLRSTCSVIRKAERVPPEPDPVRKPPNQPPSCNGALAYMKRLKAAGSDVSDMEARLSRLNCK